MAPRRSWVKADNPFWSAYVAAWYRSAGCGTLLPETRSFDGKFDTVGAPSNERGGSAHACGRSAEIVSEEEEAGTAVEEPAAKATHEALGAIATVCVRTAV